MAKEVRYFKSQLGNVVSNSAVKHVFKTEAVAVTEPILFELFEKATSVVEIEKEEFETYGLPTPELEDSADEKEADELENKTANELKVMAEELEIEVKGLKKDQMIEAIRAKIAEANPMPQPGDEKEADELEKTEA